MLSVITLGLDTSGRTLSAALACGGELLGERMLGIGYRHSLTLQPTVDELLTSCRMTLQDIELFALAAGPGSFTGIRIGLAAVQAMAWATGAKAMGVSSLRALAWSAGQADKLVLPMLDARGGRVFSSLFRSDVQLLEEEPRSIRDLLTALQGLVGPEDEVYLAGDGLAVWEAALEEDPALSGQVPFRALAVPPSFRFIRASAVIELVLADLAAGPAETSPLRLEARYGIASSAERARLAGQE